MATKCPNCGLKFRASEALCVDWRDPERSFGCPHCETFFVKDMNSKTGHSIIGALVGVGILGPSFNILFGSIDEGDRSLTTQSATIIISVFLCILVLVWGSLPFGKPLVTSPFQYKEEFDHQADKSE